MALIFAEFGEMKRMKDKCMKERSEFVGVEKYNMIIFENDNQNR